VSQIQTLKVIRREKKEMPNSEELTYVIQVLLYRCSIQVSLMCAGNDNIHLMTSDRRQRLRVDLADWEGNTTYAVYDNFKLDSAQEKYRLASVGTYYGTAGQYDVERLIVLSLTVIYH